MYLVLALLKVAPVNFTLNEYMMMMMRFQSDCTKLSRHSKVDKTKLITVFVAADCLQKPLH